MGGRTAVSSGCHGVIPTSPVAAPLLTSLPFPIKPPKPRQFHQQPEQNSNCSQTPRRHALFLLSLPALLPVIAHPPPSPAISFGISGPKEWLRDQKKKASKFVLAPIEASRQYLRTAYLLLTSESSMGSSEEVRKLLSSAGRDCVAEERNSIVAFQAKTGVEVCTFKLIVKNAASLLDDKDPVKLEAETRLDDLISSFSFLGTVMDNSDFQLNSDREKVKDGLMDTISSLDKFEQGIKDCLGV